MRRVLLILDDDRYRGLVAAARERGITVEAAIREAIDVMIRRRAAAALLAAPPMSVPDTVAELKAELRGSWTEDV